jgi:hypothetical protein
MVFLGFFWITERFFSTLYINGHHILSMSYLENQHAMCNTYVRGRRICAAGLAMCSTALLKGDPDRISSQYPRQHNGRCEPVSWIETDVRVWNLPNRLKILCSISKCFFHHKYQSGTEWRSVEMEVAHTPWYLGRFTGFGKCICTKVLQCSTHLPNNVSNKVKKQVDLKQTRQ